MHFHLLSLSPFSCSPISFYIFFCFTVCRTPNLASYVLYSNCKFDQESRFAQDYKPYIMNSVVFGLFAQDYKTYFMNSVLIFVCKMANLGHHVLYSNSKFDQESRFAQDYNPYIMNTVYIYIYIYIYYEQCFCFVLFICCIIITQAQIEL